jgi:hypothetical protein
VGLHNRNSDLWYFTLKLQKIFNSLQENFEKIVFVHLFHFTFCVFLVSEKLVSKYEHLLILTDIAISTLGSIKTVIDPTQSTTSVHLWTATNRFHNCRPSFCLLAEMGPSRF